MVCLSRPGQQKTPHALPGAGFFSVRVVLFSTRALTRTSAGNKKYEDEYERNSRRNHAQAGRRERLLGAGDLAVVGALRHGDRTYSPALRGVKWLRFF